MPEVRTEQDEEKEEKTLSGLRCISVLFENIKKNQTEKEQDTEEKELWGKNTFPRKGYSLQNVAE